MKNVHKLLTFIAVAVICSAARATSERPTVFGIPAPTFAELQNALHEAEFSGGEIAQTTERIDELVAYRDHLIVAAAIAAHPELKDTFEIYEKGQAELRARSKVARDQRRAEIAARAKSNTPSK